MRELRLVAVSEDGTSLVLSGSPGPGAEEEQRYRLPIDERLRAAVQLDRLRLGHLEIKVESSLRPREIQARIRAGEPAESVARDAGVPIEHIRRFEGPVLREREHMAEEARRARVRRDDADVGPLGEVVDARLRDLGIAGDTVRWDSWRVDDASWMVEVSYRTDDGEPARARWRFDPLRRSVRPLGPAAAELVGEPADNVRAFAPRDTPTAPSGPQSGAQSGTQSGTSSGAPSGGTAGPDPEHPVAVPEPTLAAERPDEAEVAVPPAVAAVGGAGASVSPGTPVPGGRERRRDGDGRRRASVPSWDEIMFGPKPPE